MGAKLVGRHRGVVKAVDIGRTAKGKDVLKLTVDLTDEQINGEFRELPAAISATKFSSLGREVGKSGKSPAQITVEQLKEVFGYTGGLSRLGDLVFNQAIFVCEDHNDGNFTRIGAMYNINGRPQDAGLKEFPSDVSDELKRIFGE